MPALCECGCGLPASIAQRTNTARGQIKGQPCRFKAGHKGASATATGYQHKQTVRGLMFAHIVVAEKALGHQLPAGAEVHHIDGTRRNNANANLVICQDHAYHHLLHVRTRIVQAGGNPNTDKLCSGCRRPRPLSDFAKSTTGTFGLDARCRSCAQANHRRHYLHRKENAA